MPRRKTVGRIIEKKEATEAVQKILSQEEAVFHLVKFETFKKSFSGSGLKSQQYSRYHILCHENSFLHAGWVVCPYVLNGFCAIEKGILKLNPGSGGTNKFGRHIEDHDRVRRDAVQFPRALDMPCREEIADAAAKAVVLDLRPLSFTEGAGMAKYAEAIFRAGQSIPAGVSVTSTSYVPSRKLVT